MTWTISDLM